jgi:hypothetical protein
MRVPLILFLYAAVQTSVAGVRLVSPQPLDMGKVLEKTKVEGAFRLVNESDSTFHVQQVKTSCHCTVTSFSDSVLAPRDTISVPFSINTNGLNGISRKILTIQFKEPIPDIEAVVQVQVFQRLEIQPRIIVCRNLKKGSEPVNRTFSMINNSLRPVIILQAATDDSSLIVTPNRAEVPPAGEAEFKVRFSPDKPGSHYLYVTLKTDDPESPTLEFPVSVQVVP